MKNGFAKNKIWVVLEGLNTSGKTTQGKLLEKYLNNNGVSAKYSHVFDTKLGATIRESFLSDKNLSVMVEVAILYATRFHYYHKFVECNTDYDVLITDRFTDSINSIQGAMPDCDKALLSALDSYLNVKTLPRVNILLDIEPSCIEKRAENINKDRFEKLPVEMHHKFRSRFLESFKNKNKNKNKNNYYIVNGNNKISDVHNKIRNIVMDEISNLNKNEYEFITDSNRKPMDIHNCTINNIMDEITNL